MSITDYEPVALAYRERWEQPDIHVEDLRDEVREQAMIMCSETITGPGAMVRPTSETDMTWAAKRLCALSQHPEKLERYKRQNMVGTREVMERIGWMILNGGDVTKFWAAMLLTQAVYRNAMVTAKCIEARCIQSISDVLVLAEDQRAAIDVGQGPDIHANHAAVRSKQKTRAERAAAGLEEEPVSERTQLTCLSALVNILCGGDGETWKHVVATEKPLSEQRLADDQKARRKSGKRSNLTGLVPKYEGLISACSAICYRGRRLEVPLLVAAVQVCLHLAESDGSTKAMLRASVVQNLKQHLGQNTVEGLAGEKITGLVTNSAAVLLQKYSRGHRARNIVNGLAEDNRVKHLQGFTARISYKWVVEHLKQNWKTQKKVKAFVGRFFGSREVEAPMSIGFDGFFLCVELASKQAKAAEKIRKKSVTARNKAFEAWVDHMEGEVAELMEAVGRKCQRVIALMSSDAFQRAFTEWRDMCRKAKAVKRRWLHGAIDRGWRAWRLIMDEMYALHAQVKEKCSHVIALIAGDFFGLCFREWAAIVIKKKRAMARFLNATLNYGFRTWVEHVEEENATREAVFGKCSKLLSMLATDGITMAFKNWQTFVHLRTSSRRIRKELGRRALEFGFYTWLELLDGMFELMRQCREKCSRTIAYMGGGFVIEYFKEWAKLSSDARRAKYKWRNAALVSAWRGWTREYMPYTRKLRRVRQMYSRRFELTVFMAWHFRAVEAKEEKKTIKKVLRLMTNARLLGPWRKWIEWAEDTKRYRLIITQFKRRFELRAVSKCLPAWASRAHEDAERKRRLRTLTNRINGRVMVLFMDRLSEIVEEKLRVLKASLVEKSDLLNRWTKRPMITCFELWDGLVVEEQRKAALLKRLRYRIQNNCIVVTFASWKGYIVVARGERHAKLSKSVMHAVTKGMMGEFEQGMKFHPCNKKRYSVCGTRSVIEAAVIGSVVPRASGPVRGKGAQGIVADEFGGGLISHLDEIFDQLEESSASSRSSSLTRLESTLRSFMPQPKKRPPPPPRPTPASLRRLVLPQEEERIGWIGPEGLLDEVDEAVGELLRGEMDADVRKKCEGVLDLVQHFRRANRGDDEDLVHDREEVGDGEMNGERRDKGVGQLNRAASDTSGIVRASSSKRLPGLEKDLFWGRVLRPSIVLEAARQRLALKSRARTAASREVTAATSNQVDMQDRGLVGESSHDLVAPKGNGGGGRHDHAKGNIEGHNPLSNWFDSNRLNQGWTEAGEGEDAWNGNEQGGGNAADMSFSKNSSTSTTSTRTQSTSSRIQAQNLKRGNGGYYRDSRGHAAVAAVANDDDDEGGQYGWVPDYDMDSAASRTPSWASLNSNISSFSTAFRRPSQEARRGHTFSKRRAPHSQNRRKTPSGGNGSLPKIGRPNTSMW